VRLVAAYTAAAILIALAIGCERFGTSSRESRSGPFSPTGSVGSSVPTTVVEWRCFALTPFRSTDCPEPLNIIRPTAVTPASVPSAPFNLSAIVSGTTVTLTWTGPSSNDATSFVVEAGSASGLIDLANFDTKNSAQTLTVPNVPTGTYYVRVRAKNGSGIGGSSNEIMVRVIGPIDCGAPPAAPSSLTTSVLGTSVSLSWTAPGTGCQPTAYVIEAGSASGLSNLANFNTGSTATSYSAANVGGGTYYVRVRAVNAAGVSGASNEQILNVFLPPCTPYPSCALTCSYIASPSGNSFSSTGGSGFITLTRSAGTCGWNAFSNATWITLTGVTSGSGSANLQFLVTGNSSQVTRQGAITIQWSGNSAVVPISQAGQVGGVAYVQFTTNVCSCWPGSVTGQVDGRNVTTLACRATSQPIQVSVGSHTYSYCTNQCTQPRSTGSLASGETAITNAVCSGISPQVTIDLKAK
jgi:hypothetical protein